MYLICLFVSLLIRKSFGGAGSTPINIAPPAGRLTGLGVASAPNQEGTSSKANPFASISFAPSAPMPSKPTFSFGAAHAPAAPASTPSKPLFDTPASAVKLKPLSSGFSFGSDSANNNSAQSFSFGVTSKGTESSEPKTLFESSSSSRQKESAPKATLPSLPNKKVKDLNEHLFGWIVDAWEAGHVCSEWSPGFVQYNSFVDAIEKKEDGEDTSATTNPSDKENASVSSSTPFKLTATKDDSSAFKFGSSALSVVSASSPQPATSFSFGQPAPSSTAPPAAGTFSFGFGSSAPAPAASKPISFGSIPPPSTSTSTNTDDDDPTSNPDDGKIEQVKGEQNTEEDVLFEVKARPMKMISKEEGWKKYGAGVCRLYKHKTTSKHRLVIRNEIGKVQFNVAVSAKMTFDKVTKDGKKGKTAYVKFFAVVDAAEGPKPITLQVGPGDLDGFHSALVNMTE